MFGLEDSTATSQMEAIESKIAEVKGLILEAVNPSDETGLVIRLTGVTVSLYLF